MPRSIDCKKVALARAAIAVGLPFAEAARRAGVTPRTIWNWRRDGLLDEGTGGSTQERTLSRSQGRTQERTPETTISFLPFSRTRRRASRGSGGTSALNKERSESSPPRPGIGGDPARVRKPSPPLPRDLRGAPLRLEPGPLEELQLVQVAIHGFRKMARCLGIDPVRAYVAGGKARRLFLAAPPRTDLRVVFAPLLARLLSEERCDRGVEMLSERIHRWNDRAPYRDQIFPEEEARLRYRVKNRITTTSLMVPLDRIVGPIVRRARVERMARRRRREISEREGRNREARRRWIGEQMKELAERIHERTRDLDFALFLEATSSKDAAERELRAALEDVKTGDPVDSVIEEVLDRHLDRVRGGAFE